MAGQHLPQALLTLLWLVAAPGAAEPPAAPSRAAATPARSAYARLEAALLVETLNSELLSHDSATLTLQGWCSKYRLASPPRVVAERVAGAQKAPGAAQRRLLRVSPQDPVRYRRVRLRCGRVVLSEADNWYVPARLTPAMNRTLETTDTPFGIAVRPLHFRRHTLSARVLWPVLQPDWATRPHRPPADGGAPCIPARVLQQRAILTLPDSTPFSEVVETYTGNVLAVPVLGRFHGC